jgi:hypothetical protein
MYARLAHGGVATQAWYGLGFGNYGVAYNSATDALYDSTGAAYHGGVFRLVRSAVDLSLGAWTSAGAWANPYTLALDAMPVQSPLWPSATERPPFTTFTVAAGRTMAAPYTSVSVPAGTYGVDYLRSSEMFKNGWMGESGLGLGAGGYKASKGIDYVAPSVFGALAKYANWRSADGNSHTAAYEAWVKATFDPAMFLNTDTNAVWNPADGISKMKLRYCSGNYTQYGNTAYWLAFPLVTGEQKTHPFYQQWRGTVHPDGIVPGTIGACTDQWYYRWGYTSAQSPKRVALSRYGFNHDPSWRAAGGGYTHSSYSVSKPATVNQYGQNQYNYDSCNIFGNSRNCTGIADGAQYNATRSYSADPLLNFNATFIELRGYPNGNFNAGEATLLAKVDTQIFLNANSASYWPATTGNYSSAYGMHSEPTGYDHSFAIWFPLLASGSWSHYQLSLPYNGVRDTGTRWRTYGPGAEDAGTNREFHNVTRIVSTFGSPHFAMLGA